MDRTSRSLRQWFDEEGEATPDYAFRNARGDQLTRQGVTHLLDRARQRARERCPSLAAKCVSPHVVRHTTAMHLLQAGVDIATIALWLGHERLETTHQYVEDVEADFATQGTRPRETRAARSTDAALQGLCLAADLPGKPLTMESAARPQPRPPSAFGYLRPNSAP